MQHLIDEAHPLVTDDVGGRNSDIVEVDQARVGAVHSNLVNLLCLKVRNKNLKLFILDQNSYSEVHQWPKYRIQTIFVYCKNAEHKIQS